LRDRGGVVAAAALCGAVEAHLLWDGLMSSTVLRQTPLHALHIELGARMVPFAGYDMPVQYPTGILAEHLRTRAAAGLFDVSHMGQAFLEGPDAARRFELLAPTDIATQPIGRIRYTQLLNESGGILDDLMVVRRPAEKAGEERLVLVVNAACKDNDFAHIRRQLPDLRLQILEDRALIALQGPKAASVLARRWPKLATQPFMSIVSNDELGEPQIDAFFSRSGYTGEDGFEISLPAGEAEAFVRSLLAEAEVKPIGLGARDSLRLEAGLCLYGHDIDETTSPVEAGLSWSIPKRRRTEGGFPGAPRILQELAEGPARRRVGLRPEGKAPAREGAEIIDADGAALGRITSGSFGPSVGAPVAMGYVDATKSAPGAIVDLVVRGKKLPARIAPMPFHPHAYFRGS
jgi:aminomethyltransferase